jgi:hypothetical protein
MRTRVRLCVRVRSRAGADDALIRGMCASAARSPRSAIDGTRAGIAYRYMLHACIYIHARPATRMKGSAMRARRRDARTCCARVRARACACAIGRPRIRADTCEPVPSVWTAGGSARRRSRRRRRSTRTSARGTPRVSPTCPMYEPPFRHGRRATAGGTRSAGLRCGAGRCARRDRRCARACLCAQTCGHAHARVCTCVGIAARTKDGILCMYLYICLYMISTDVCILHTCIGICVVV